METENTQTAFNSLQWAGLSRRHFLKGMLATAGTVSIGGGIGACSVGDGEGPDGHRLLFLDEGEAAVLTALGEAIIPTQAGFPDLARAGVIRRIDQELSLVDDAIQGDVRAAIDVLQFSPLVYGRFSRFSRLTPDGRREILKRLMNSRSEILRAVGANLKLIIHFYYFAHPSSWAAMGFDGTFGRMPQKLSEQDHWYQKQAGLPVAGEKQV